MEAKKQGLLSNLKRYFLSGLLFWLPVITTVYVIKFIVDILDLSINVLPQNYQPEHLFGISIPGFGVLLSLAVLFLTGCLVANLIGEKIMHFGERFLDRIPLVRSIYNGSKKVSHAIFSDNSHAFRKVVMIEYPRAGLHTLAFQTAPAFFSAPHQQEVISVIVPTTPNPTSGFLLLIPKCDTIELSISVEEAFRYIISLGVITPEQLIMTTPSSHTERA